MTDHIDLTALRTLAESATPGPWEAEDGVFLAADGLPLISRLRDGNGDGFFESAADAQFIAAANPATVLRLLDALETVLDEHPRYEGDFSDFCGHCQTRGEGTWPCPTVTAITTALGADDD